MDGTRHPGPIRRTTGRTDARPKNWSQQDHHRSQRGWERLMGGRWKTHWCCLLFAALLTGSALAQTPPYVYPLTIGTSSTSILTANPTRKKLIFHNPNDTAKVAVCPVGPSRSSGGANIVAVINGAGCMTLLPYDRY